MNDYIALNTSKSHTYRMQARGYSSHTLLYAHSQPPHFPSHLQQTMHTPHNTQNSAKSLLPTPPPKPALKNYTQE
ncbi:hypothetical protein CC86DRAFT_127873 [Ophiobolus disseminans]|uniref:Uncharacterized protein n=1 Tax=Ophiobolus disseminans TaxID=1469910 RepID=A0A6A6ZFG6_9PLEO|nr:hypothetical protein CC86DRAFT_127873 [Ophiobolus disseminans]